GLLEAVRCALSYARARLAPRRSPRSFEDWVVAQFGRRLFEIFFKTYTEKVWGMPCKEISADWAAQRIKGLSLASAVLRALLPRRKPRGEVIKTLIDSFRYPRKGPGMMWEACAEKVRARGGRVLMGAAVAELAHDRSVSRWTVVASREGTREQLVAAPVVSSTPLRGFARDWLWSSSDADLLALAAGELERVGLATRSEVLDGCVVRQPKAYPVYDASYAANVEVIRRELKDRFPTLHVTGRNGMHKYN